MFSYVRRVQFYETDAQSIVHHSNYFKYLEEARGELLRSLGFPYSSLRQKGLEVVLLSASCEFLKPLVYDEEFRVHVNISHLDRFTFSFEYLLETNTELKAKANTRHCILKEKKIVSIPKEIRESLSQFFSGPCRHSKSQR